MKARSTFTRGGFGGGASWRRTPNAVYRGKRLGGWLTTLVAWALAAGPILAPRAAIAAGPTTEAAPRPGGFATQADLSRAAGLAAPALAPAASVVSGPQKVMVLRVYFADYAATSRYTKAQVEGFFTQLDQLWRDTSYGVMSIAYQVSDLYQLPDNRSEYIDDFDTGDLSNGGKFTKVLNDAIANAPADLDWSDLAAIMVVMAEIDPSQFHRGQATGSCNLPMGPGGATAAVGCAIFSENPSDSDVNIWGRWAHEVGHAFQQGGPAHPSNYNNEFELLDSNYPGQTGVFEKQEHVAFPGWLPTGKYQIFDPASGGGTANIWAMEYPPAGLPNAQAVKAKITDTLYYLISVRRRVLGDELNGGFTPPGIPDEGVLIERVSEGSDPWVTVKGPGGDRNELWGEGELYSNTGDGVFILVAKKIDDDHYQVRVTYNEQFAMQPDVGLEPWVSPPGNGWETTDIWIDSPVNGFGTYRYGMWNDLSGNPVPVGNGDAPAIGMGNRLYARVRNVGGATATDIVVHWEITDPPGVGIAGASGWVEIGSVDSGGFPALASLAPGAFTDVYAEWTPDFPIPDEALEDGLFDFHTCIRVLLDHVANETAFGNQDGDREQENVTTFQAVEESAGEPMETSIRLFNDDLSNPKFFYLSYRSDLPTDWQVVINGGDMGVELAPGEVREIPVSILPGAPAELGDVFGVDLAASSMRVLVSDLDPNDQHHEFKTLGGVRVEVRSMRKPKLSAATQTSPNGVLIVGRLDVADFPRFYDPEHPLLVMLIGLDANRRFVEDSADVVRVDREGNFQGQLRQSKSVPTHATCLFAGTALLASASCGMLELPLADLALTKSAAPNPVVAGASLTYTLSVVNHGPAAATGVRLVDALPEGMVLLQASASQGVCALVGGEVRCELGVLAAGASAEVKLIVRPHKPGMVENVATLSAAQADPVSTNNQARARTQVLAAIDIWPQLKTNVILLGTNHKFPVAILSNPGFDAPREVDRRSLTFGRSGDEKSLFSCNSKPSDVNGDGLGDLLCTFRSKPAAFRLGDVLGVLRGRLLNGKPFEGVDSVLVLLLNKTNPAAE
ncbi:MAG TPA: DUF11 domain-containing protein [Anaerolineales bacterium]|nr:DUF11 domain-containing protein [Anaerolineales bacterium]